MAKSFYCNHCGKKVSRSASQCPSCGRYFGAVLCPSCGYSGEESLFAEGCPSCGYLGSHKEKGDHKDSPKEKKDNTILNLPPLFFYVGTAVLLLSLIVLLRFL